MEQKRTFKRLLSILVVVTMLFSSFAVLAVPVAAEDPDIINLLNADYIAEGAENVTVNDDGSWTVTGNFGLAVNVEYDYNVYQYIAQNFSSDVEFKVTILDDSVEGNQKWIGLYDNWVGPQYFPAGSHVRTDSIKGVYDWNVGNNGWTVGETVNVKSVYVEFNGTGTLTINALALSKTSDLIEAPIKVETEAPDADPTYFEWVDEWKEVDEYGVWQSGKAPAEEDIFDYDYAVEEEGTNVNIGIRYTGSLTGKADFYGNGNGTNFRIWFKDPTSEKGWDALMDVSYNGSEWLTEYRTNGEASPYKYGYAATEKPFTVTVVEVAGGVDVLVEMPIEVLGYASDYFMVMVSASNNETYNENTNAGNACLHCNNSTNAPTAVDRWDGATVIGNVYKAGLTIEVNSDEVVPLGETLTIADIEAGLTDGNWGAGSASDWSNASGIYCLNNTLCKDATQHPEVNLIYNLGKATEINTIKLGVYSSYNVMIGYPDNFITVYTSDDGLDWTWADTKYLLLDAPAVGNEGSTYAIAKLSDSINAKYVKVVLAFADSPFTVESGKYTEEDAKPVWEFMGLTEYELSYVEPIDFAWVDEWKEVDEYGTYQESKEVPEAEIFDYDYAIKEVGDNVNVGIKYTGSLSGSADSYGNGNGTNFRIWFKDPASEKGWDALMDVSYNGSEWLTEYRTNGANPYEYPYSATEKPFTATVVEVAGGVDVLVEMPIEVLGYASDYFMVMVSASNNEVNNYCLHCNNSTNAPTAVDRWNGATVIGNVYEAGLTIEVNSDEVAPLGETLTIADIEKGLTDGNWGAGSASDWSNASGIYVMQNKVCTDATQHPEVNLIYTFEEAKKIGAFKLGVYSSYNSMIGYPANEVAVYTSDNGLDWIAAGTADLGLDAPAIGAEGSVTATATLENAVTARYVKLVLTFADSPFTVESGNYTEANAKPVWEFMGLTELELIEVGTAANPDAIEITSGFRGYMGEGVTELKGGAEYYWNINVPVDGDINVQFYVFDDESYNYAVDYSFNGGELYNSYNYGNPALEDLEAGDVVTLYCKVAEDVPTVTVSANVSLDAVGSQSNPEEITEAGDMTTVIDENDMDGGHTYSYTAPGAGEVTVTIADDNTTGWLFSVSNVDKYVYGDTRYSDDDPLVKSETIKVAKGDVITIAIGTYGGMSPAGTVAWNLTYTLPTTSKVVTDFNPESYRVSIGGSTGAFIYDDAELYANSGLDWWRHVMLVPSADVEGGYEVVAIRAPQTGNFLTLAEDAIIWAAWVSASETPDSPGAYAFEFMGTLMVGDIVKFNGVDFANQTTTADATAEKWIDPNAPVAIDIESYTASKEGEWQHWTYDTRDDGIRLIDGTKGGTDVLPSMSGWYFNSSSYPDGGTVELVFNLGGSYDVSSVVGYFYHYYPEGYSSVDTITVSYSADGEAYTAIEAEAVKTILNDVAYPTYSLTVTPAEEVTASYIKVVLTGTANSLIITDEIEAYGKAHVEAPKYNEGLNIELDETVTAPDGIIAGLTDGKWAEDATAYNADGVYLIQNGSATDASKHPAINFIWKYAEATEFNTIKLGLYGEYISMVGYPAKDIVVSTSADGGITWEQAEVIDLGVEIAEGDKGTEIVTLTLSEAITTELVKITVTYPDSPFAEKVVWEFVGFTEVELSKKTVEYIKVEVNVNENEILTDGKTGFSGNWGDIGTGDVLLIENQECTDKAMEVALLYALGETKSINSLALDFYHCALVMIGYPEGQILVEVSTDGETYTEVGSYDITSADLAVGAYGTVTTVCEFDAVDAAYVKATFIVGSSTGVLGDSPTDGKIFWQFASIAEVAVGEAPVVPVVQPVDKVTLPDDAINLDYAGYKHEGGLTIITATDVETTLGALSVKGDAEGLNGEAGDFNYWSVIIVDAEGKVIYSNATLGRDVEGGIKTDVVVPAGAVVIATHGGSELAKVGQIVKIYNIDLAALATLNGYVALEQAGYTVEDAPVVSIGDVNNDGAIDKYDYILVKRQIMGTIELSDDQTVAADVNDNGEIEVFDYILIKRHIFGTYVIGGSSEE